MHSATGILMRDSVAVLRCKILAEGGILMYRATQSKTRFSEGRPLTASGTRGPIRLIGLLALAALSLTAGVAEARTAALSASWSGLKSDILDWPSHQFSFNGYLGPLGRGLYLVPGLTLSHDSGEHVTAVGVYLNVHHMLPAGDRFVPFLEGGLIGKALRLDVIDTTEGGLTPTRDRTTYIRGGVQIGGGFDLALGGNWSIVAAVRGVFLRSVDTQLVRRGDRILYLEEDPSYWELPRLAIVYWY